MFKKPEDKSCCDDQHCHESESECSTCSPSCSCPCHNHHKESCHGHKYVDCLFEIADQAWMEVLKCKIKEEIKKTSDEHLNEMAKIVSEANHKRWANKMASKCAEEELECNLKNLKKKQCNQSNAV